jgi:hypothetical protein
LGLTGGIDNAAHIGGLLSGALIGIILYKLDDGKKTDITARVRWACKCQRTLSCRTEPLYSATMGISINKLEFQEDLKSLFLE